MNEQSVSDRAHAIPGGRSSSRRAHSLGPSDSRLESIAENREKNPPLKREHLIDAKAAAAMLWCSPRTVKRLAEQGEIPAMKIGNRWRFSPNLLAEWCQKRLSSNTAQPVSDESEG